MPSIPLAATWCILTPRWPHVDQSPQMHVVLSSQIFLSPDPTLKSSWSLWEPCLWLLSREQSLPKACFSDPREFMGASQNRFLYSRVWLLSVRPEIQKILSSVSPLKRENEWFTEITGTVLLPAGTRKKKKKLSLATLNYVTWGFGVP